MIFKRGQGFLSKRVQLFQKRCIERTLKRYSGNVTKTAMVLERNRVEFYRLMDQLGIVPKNFRTPKEKREHDYIHR